MLKSLLSRVLAAFAALTLSAGAAQAEPAIWTLSDDDSDIYLFGTVHLLPPEVEWRSDRFETAFAASDIVYFEAPVQDPDAQAGMVQVIQRLGLNPPGVALSSLLSDEGNALLAEIGPRLGVPPVALEPMRPWLAGVTIGVSQIVADGYDPNSGVETTLWPEAVAAGKQLAFFETLEQQIGFFGNLPIEDQVEFLEDSLAQIDDTPDLLDQLVETWVAGDVSGFEALMNESMRDETPALYEALIVDRNIAWADEIETLLDGSGVIFIAVGAAHLPGEDGVVRLLRDRGYEVAGP